MMTIVPPQAEYCDCIHDFILNILNQKPDHIYVELCQNNQHERCQLNECDVVKHFRLPIFVNENSGSNHDDSLPSIVETIVDPSISYVSDVEQYATTHLLPVYVHRHTSVHHSSSIDQSNRSFDGNAQVVRSSLCFD
jgi:hypothetical protein